MDITYAKELLEMLADGVDPKTGEVLSGNDSCNQPDVIRALHLAVTILEKAEKAEKRERNLPENAGKPWTQEADDKLIEMFNQGFPNRDICNEFKRTEGAIASRLVRLGKIRERDDFRNRK